MALNMGGYIPCGLAAQSSIKGKDQAPGWLAGIAGWGLVIDRGQIVEKTINPGGWVCGLPRLARRLACRLGEWHFPALDHDPRPLLPVLHAKMGVKARCRKSFAALYDIRCSRLLVLRKSAMGGLGRMAEIILSIRLSSAAQGRINRSSLPPISGFVCTAIIGWPFSSVA